MNKRSEEDPIAQRTQSLQAQIKQHEELAGGKLEQNPTVYIGDGYFASMPAAEAKEFINRKLELMKQELEALNQLGGLNEEGLPVFDIVEELDDNDEVVSSNVNRTGLGADLGLHRLVNNNPVPKFESSSNTPPVGNSERKEPELDRYDEDKSDGEFRDIDPSDVLELQLLSDSDENIDFDFDDLEMEDETSDDGGDSDDDRPDYGMGGMFPNNEATKRAIEAHLAQSDAEEPRISEIIEREVEEHVEPSARKSSLKQNREKDQPRRGVHFANKIDVREFETSSDERKNHSIEIRKFDPPPSYYRLKSFRQHPPRPPFPPSHQPSPSSVGVAGAAAAAAIASSSKVHGSVVEREPASPPKRHMPPVKSPTRPKILAKEVKESPKSNGQRTPAPFLRKTNIPHHSVKQKVALKQKVAQDADKIFQESFVPDVEFLKLHDSEPENGKNEKQNEKVETPKNPKDTRPILSGVQEKTVDDEDVDLLDENNVDMSEIKREYQHLRQKLIYESGGFRKPDSEKAVEPLDEVTGEPKKVSRFKAARIN